MSPGSFWSSSSAVCLVSAIRRVLARFSKSISGREARLTVSKKGSRTAQFKINFGEIKTTRMFFECLESI